MQSLWEQQLSPALAVVALSCSVYQGFWEDCGLPAPSKQDRFEYGQLRSKLEAELRNASQFLQAELDKLTLIHKLRTEGEFQRLATMWKNFANLRAAFNTLPHIGSQTVPRDEPQRSAHEANCRKEFNEALDITQQSFYEEMVFIPKHIAGLAESTLQIAKRERTSYLLRLDDLSFYSKASRATLEEYNKQMFSLEEAIRETFAMYPTRSKMQLPP